MSRFLRIFLGVILLASPLRASIGISTRFVDLEIENVPIGAPHRLDRLGDKPYSIRNRSSTTVRARVIVRAPAPDQTSPDYEPIPDPSWIQVIPNELVLKPGERSFAKVVMLLPRNKSYLGRHFQAMIIATTDSPALVNASVESRLRFSTGPKPEEREWTETSGFVLENASPTITLRGGLSTGPSPDGIRSINVKNRSGRELDLRCEIVPWNPAFSSMEFETSPNPAWLKIRTPELKIARGGTGKARLSINVPKGTYIKGKNYVFLVAFYDVLKPRSRAYGRIFVRFK